MRVVLSQLRTWSPDGEANFDNILRVLQRSSGGFFPSDLIVLPELAGGDLSHKRYLACVRSIAAATGAWVVGGSHHHRYATRVLNSGVVIDPSGDIVAHYHKQHPYGVERRLGVEPGRDAGSFLLHGRRVLVLICADLWHSETFASPSTRDADVIAVPTFSITQRSTPDPARTLWRHMAISRAYERTAFVAISDWAAGVAYEGQPACGVAGFAHPRPPDGRRFFTPLGRRQFAAFAADFPRLTGLRDSQRERSFLRQ